MSHKEIKKEYAGEVMSPAISNFSQKGPIHVIDSLLDAIQSGKSAKYIKESVQKAQEQKIDLNHVGSNGWTLLAFAAHSKQEELVEFIAPITDVNQPSLYGVEGNSMAVGNTPVLAAIEMSPEVCSERKKRKSAEESSARIVEILCRQGADPNKGKGKKQTSPLQTAALLHNVKGFSALVYRGASYAKRKKDGITPMMCALSLAKDGGLSDAQAIFDMVQCIFHHFGPEIFHEKDEKGQRLFEIKNKDALSYYNQKKIQKNQALEKALISYIKIFKHTSLPGIGFDKLNHWEKIYYLNCAALNGDLERAKIFVEEHKLPVNFQDIENRHSLVEAARGNHLAMVNYLLEKKADVNAFGFGGYTAMHFAALHGNIKLLTLLINAGAQFKAAKDAESMIPAVFAKKRGYEEFIKVLIEFFGEIIVGLLGSWDLMKKPARAAIAISPKKIPDSAALRIELEAQQRDGLSKKTKPEAEIVEFDRQNGLVMYI